MKIQEFIKYWPSVVIFFAGIAGAWATMVATNRDSKQKDNIEEYGRKNAELGEKTNDLSTSIESLGKINNALAQGTRQVIEENNKLAQTSINLASQNSSLAKKIIDLTETVRDLNTGGSSYPDFRNVHTTMYEKGVNAQGIRLDLSLEMYNKGSFAIDNLRLKAYGEMDYSKIDPSVLWMQLSTSGLNIHSRFAHFRNLDQSILSQNFPSLKDAQFEVFKPGQSELLGPVRFKVPFKFYGINLFVESKRQDWIILIRFFRPDPEGSPFTLQAYRIMRMTGEGLEDIYPHSDPGFPRNENGQIQWFKSELPDLWFAHGKSQTRPAP